MRVARQLRCNLCLGTSLFVSENTETILICIRAESTLMLSLATRLTLNSS